MGHLNDNPDGEIAMVEIIEVAPEGGFRILLHTDRQNTTPITKKCSRHFKTLREAEIYAMREFGVGCDGSHLT